MSDRSCTSRMIPISSNIYSFHSSGCRLRSLLRWSQRHADFQGDIGSRAGECRQTARTASAELIEKANAAGGKDNISAIVVEAEDLLQVLREKSGPRTERPLPGSFSSSPARVFRGRWAFLLYGLVAGLLVSYFWLRPAETRSDAAGDLHPFDCPRCFRVCPGQSGISDHCQRDGSCSCRRSH